MKIYRLYTENKHRSFIEHLVARYFSGFTIYKAIGYWQGKKEKSLVIEIVSDSGGAYVFINLICKAICGYNKQQTVMVLTSEINSEFKG